MESKSTKTKRQIAICAALLDKHITEVVGMDVTAAAAVAVSAAGRRTKDAVLACLSATH